MSVDALILLAASVLIPSMACTSTVRNVEGHGHAGLGIGAGSPENVRPSAEERLDDGAPNAKKSEAEGPSSPMSRTRSSVPEPSSGTADSSGPSEPLLDRSARGAKDTGPLGGRAMSSLGVEEAILGGEVPWWHGLIPGPYLFEGRVVLLAVGESEPRESFTTAVTYAMGRAKVRARRTRDAFGLVAGLPDAEVIDVFITRTGECAVLAQIPVMLVPTDTAFARSLRPLDPPPAIAREGRRRIGRHWFEGNRHLYMNCDVEGPYTNPEWNASRASARRMKSSQSTTPARRFSRHPSALGPRVASAE